jgi:hypothetical protein
MASSASRLSESDGLFIGRKNKVCRPLCEGLPVGRGEVIKLDPCGGMPIS